MIISKIIYVLVVLMVYVFSILYIDNLALVILLACLMLPVFLGIVMLVGSIKMRFVIKTKEHSCYRNDSVDFKVIAEKALWLPVCYKFTVKAINKYTGEVSTRTFKGIISSREQELSFKMKCTHCGHIQIDICNSKVYDYLKIFSKKLKMSGTCNLVVMPNLHEFEGKLVTMPTLNDESNVYSPVKSGDDPSEIFDIHQFKDGDDPRRIHWKLSSRSEEYFVKEYSHPLLNSIVLLIDNQQRNISKHDGLFDLALSMSNFLLQNKIGHKMAVLSEDLVLKVCNITNDDELFDTADGLLSKPININGKISVVDTFINSEHNRNAHLIFLTTEEKSTKNPLLYNQPIPVTVMLMTDKPKDNIETDKNYRCFYVNEKNIQASLEGIEL